MAAGKTSQSNTSLIALVIFILLFLISATVAVIFYTKFEDEKALKLTAEQNAVKLAKNSEQQNLDSKIVGKPTDGKSYIGMMDGYINELIQIITGDLPEANAATKTNEVKIKINETIEALGEDTTAVFGTKGVNLLFTIQSLKTKLDQTRKQASVLNSQVAKLQNDIEIIQAAHAEEIENHNAKISQANAERDDVLNKYNMLESLMTQSTQEQVQSWAQKLEKAKLENNEKQEQIENLNANIEDLNEQLRESLDILESFKSTPDKAVLAHQPDAIVHTADTRNGLVYLNKGRKDHIYVGLTFSLFDRNAPIPEDGKGKAEIEVFRVEENSSVAKILTSSPKDPILTNDVAVNMIWDSKESNSFMIVGEFDFDGNGQVDLDGKEKIAHLIRQWGGTIVSELTVNTDFLVVGTEPKEKKKPTQNMIDNYPDMLTEYEESKEDVAYYGRILERSDLLSVPVFNRDRFLSLIGYESSAAMSTPSYNINAQ